MTMYLKTVKVHVIYYMMYSYCKLMYKRYLKTDKLHVMYHNILKI